MVEHRIDAIRGDSFAFSVRIDDAQGREVESLTFKVKENRDATANLISLSIGSGITQVEEGLYSVNLDPSDTAEMDPKEYYYLCRLGLDDDIYTLIRGAFNLIKVE